MDKQMLSQMEDGNRIFHQSGLEDHIEAFLRTYGQDDLAKCIVNALQAVGGFNDRVELKLACYAFAWKLPRIAVTAAFPGNNGDEETIKDGREP